MSRYGPVELLRPDHDAEALDCGSEQQTIWLRRYALTAQRAGTSRVYVVCRSGATSIAGYYALAAASVLPEEASTRLAAGAGRHRIPVVILTRLGVDLMEQGQGLGSALVRDAFARVTTAAGTIGVRGLLIHSGTPRAAAFYRQIDPAFESLPGQPLHLVLLMKDVGAAIRRAARQPADDGD